MSRSIRPVDASEFMPVQPGRTGRRPALTPTQRAQLQLRYAMYLQNRPAALCREYGISLSTLKHIVNGHFYKNDP